MTATNPHPATVTAKEFALRIGRSIRRVQQLNQDDVLVKSSRGKLKLVESLEALVRYQYENRDDIKEQAEVARLERTQNEAALLEIRIAKESGELIDAAEAEAGLAQYVVGVNKLLDGLAGQIKSNWPGMPAEAEQSIRTSIVAAKQQGRRVHLRLDADDADE